jgi:methionine-rich copper-binding protein CopC
VEPLKTALADAEKAKLDLQGMLGAARAEVARLAAQLAPMTVALPSATVRSGVLRTQGTTASVTGPGGSEVEVDLTVGFGTARRLGLRSARLGRATATLGVDGTAAVTVKPGRKARKALRKAGRAVAFSVVARSGDRIATSGATATVGKAAPTSSVAGSPVAVAAHTELESTKPSRGGSAGTGLRIVTATFSQSIRSGTLKVFRKGVKKSKGSGGRDPRDIARLKASMKPGLKAGRYTARWTIEAADGHDQSGSFSFRLG